ncbi:acyl carrier protein [Legionella spiritensis]|uniref:Phosphopantetheine attachment site n=1 Tax=Legionella spiritensis TaxID=452 RepID=A0A0W0YZ48_LEGSP|nr:acyl carrier protein [Legionella spiritensis]KTD62107.1 Phosphopantetheine attachment site [Legionella spiritensis]SNV34223.1 Phosphopantetheine attachment site [Legionella spiritensis]VEG92524.1 Phosphopantetheine attachment site [Legionella spiritensis]
MNKDLLLNDLAKLLELDKHLLSDTFLLNDEANWDSLAVVSTVAAIDQHYKVSVRGSELMSCNTVKDIFYLIENFN